jgi:hypothetical protein
MNSNTTSFELTEADLLTANRTHFWNYYLSAMGLRLLGGVLMLYSSLGLFLFLWNDYELNWANLIAMIENASLMTAVVALMVGLSFWQMRRRVRRSFAELRALHGWIEVSWDRDALMVVAPNHQSRYPWGDFFKWTENGSVMMLYQSQDLFTPLPKRALSNADSDAIRSALAAHGVPWVGRHVS